MNVGSCLCEGWKVALLESMNKRCVFLEHAVGVTGLSNVQVIRERAEVMALKIAGLACGLIMLQYLSQH